MLTLSALIATFIATGASDAGPTAPGKSPRFAAACSKADCTKEERRELREAAKLEHKAEKLERKAEKLERKAEKLERKAEKRERPDPVDRAKKRENDGERDRKHARDRGAKRHPGHHPDYTANVPMRTK